MATFRSLHNPEFKLWSFSLPQTICFTNGTYTTHDPAEVRVLRGNPSVEEVAEKQRKRKPRKQKLKKGGVLPKAEPQSPTSPARGHVDPNDPTGS